MAENKKNKSTRFIMRKRNLQNKNSKRLNESLQFQRQFILNKVKGIIDEWFKDNQPTKGDSYLDNELFILATESKLEQLKQRLEKHGRK